MREPIVEGFRLSPQQRRLWSLQQNSDGCSFFCTAAVRIDGPLQTEQLDAAIESAVSQHEILRTSLRSAAGLLFPLQVIGNSSVMNRSYQDWRFANRAERNNLAAAWVNSLQSDPKWFETALHVLLARTASDCHRLHIGLSAFHCDPIGLQNLIRQIAVKYEQRRAPGESAEILQFADLAAWQNELLESDEANAGRAWWESRKIHRWPAARLAEERRLSNTDAIHLQRVTFNLDPPLVARIEALTQQLKCEPRLLLLAVWIALVSRLSAERDVALAYYCSARRDDELRDVVGSLGRFVPLRINHVPSARLSDLVSTVKAATAEAEQWQDFFAWERMTSETGQDHASSLYAFSYEESPASIRSGEVDFSIEESFAYIDRFKLTLCCHRLPELLSIEFQYDTTVFEQPDVERLSRRLQSFLGEVVDRPDISLDRPSVLVSEERNLLAELNDTKTDLEPKRIHELFEQHAALRGDAIATVYRGQHVSYAELNSRANRVARHLKAAGAGPEARVAILLDRSIEAVVSILGVLKSGAAYVPLDPRLPPQRLARMVEHIAPVMVICQSCFAGILPNCEPSLWMIDQDWDDVAQYPRRNLPPTAMPGNLAYLMFTSGSTGTPKGVMIEHRQLFNYVQAIRERLDIRLDARFAIVSTLAADLGNTMTFGSLCCGGCLHLLPEDAALDANTLRDYFSRERIETLKIVPSHLAALHELEGSQELLPLRTLILGGEASRVNWIAQLQAAAPDLAIHNHYGPTEATIGITTFPVTGDQRAWASGDIVPLGRPLANGSVFVLSGSMQPLPLRVTGELFLGGESLARGYFDRPGQTAELFVPNPFAAQGGSRLYRTGDRGRISAESQLEFLGRIDHQVKLRGYRIELGEIEATLSQHPDVGQCVVDLRFSPAQTAQLVAFVVAKCGREENGQSGEHPSWLPAKLRTYLQTQLPEYMVPSFVVVLDELPRNANGKVNRDALPDVGQSDVDQSFVAPSTPTEKLLAGLWGEFLGLQRVSVNDDFFRLGGHSLLLTRLIARMRQVFQLELPLRLLLNARTIVQLAAEIDKQQSRGSVSTVAVIPPVDHRHPLSLSFGQERLWFLDHFEPHSPAYNVPYAWRLKEDLVPAALEQSLAEIERRHESLRTRFPGSDGQPRQVIESLGNRCLKMIDLQSLSEDECERIIQRLTTEESLRTFDLERGPLLRTTLLRAGPRDHVLLLSMHHIVCDAWSLDVLWRELGTLYQACVKPTPSPLAELAIQYADYASWQRDWLSGEKLVAELEYWRQQCLGLKALELPADRPRPKRQTFVGGRQYFRLSSDITQRLRELSRRAEVTLFTTCLAIFQTLLYRYTGQPDVAVGSPVANRDRPEIEHVIGFFLNTLVLRGDLSGNPSILEVLQRTRRTMLEAYAHQELPFEKLVDEVEIRRDLSRTPLFQSMFVFLAGLPSAPVLAGVSASRVEREHALIRSDLDLCVWDDEEKLGGYFTYNTDLFDASTIARLSRRFVALAESVVQSADTAIDDLAVDPPLELPGLPTRGAAATTGSLSYHQERLWFIDQFETGNVYEASPIYHNLSLVVHFRGPVDIDVLEQSINDVITRHQILHTTFVNKDGQGHQQVIPDQKLKLGVQHVADSGESDVTEQAVALGLDQARIPFVLDRDLPVRARCFRITDAESVLVMTVHHIVADTSSLRLIAEEIAEFYRARAEGRSPQIEEPAIGYLDYAQWQRGLPEDTLEPLSFYWKRQLRGQLQALTLPTNRTRPAVQAYTAARWAFALDGRLAARIREFSEAENIGVFEILLAAFKVLLGRYSNQEEVVVGTSASGRGHPGTEKLVGPLANLLVLRSSLAGSPTFREFLRRISATVRQAFRHEELPFDRLVQELNPQIDMSRTALFDVLFQFQDSPPLELNLGSAQGWVVPINSGHGKYDIHLSLQGSATEFAGTWIYNADLFDGCLIEQMARHWEMLLELLTSDPHQPVDKVDLLGAEERRRQIVDWNSTDARYPDTCTIHQIFEHQVATHPDAIAVMFEQSQLTYRELNERSNQLAHHLRERGVTAETLVALCIDRSLEMIVAMLGVLKAGGAYLPLDPEYPDERRRYMLEDACVSHVISTSARIGPFADNVACIILLDVDREAILGQPSEAPSLNTSPDNLAYCIYTSGSTGKPKGVLLEHRQVVRLMINSRLPFSFADDDVWIMFHSYCFDFSVWEMYGALLYGGKLVIVPENVRKDPRLFLELMSSEGVTVLNQTPSAFSQLMRHILPGDGPNLALRYVVFGGEALDPKQLDSWKHAYSGVRLINMYGITETTVHVTFKELSAEDVQKSASNIGEPIPTTKTYVMDPASQLLPVGVPGELNIGGAGLARGYLRRPGLTAERFLPDPFSELGSARLYKSGDLVRYLANGNLEFLGRIDHQVKLRGFRVELGEIESVLNDQPSIKHCVVMLREDRPGEQRLVAYCVPAGGCELNFGKLGRHLRSVVPEYMVPASFVALDALPLTFTGKVDRRMLPVPDVSRPGLETTYVGARNSTEEQLARIWIEVLAVDRIGVHDNFFALGGHSLLATRVIARLNTAFDCNLSVRLLFDRPTVAELAEALRDRSQETGGTRIEPMRREAPLALSFGQERLWFLDQFEPNSPSYNVPCAWRLTGKLIPAAIEQSLAEIERRHEILRTSFPGTNGYPQQVVELPGRCRLRTVDLQILTEQQRPRTIQRLVTEESLRPFQLAQGPPLRTTLLRIGPEDHVLLLSMHHIVCDAWSVEVLRRELWALYQAYAVPSPSCLLELPVQYADYASWQRHWLSGDRLTRQLDYWRRQLSELTVLELPVDRPRPKRQTSRGGRELIQLPADLSQQLRQLSHRQESTLFMTLLAAFQTLLHRYTSQTDVVIGSPIANRSRPEIEGLIGFFLNTLVLRGDLSGDPSFLELLRRTRQTALEAYACQDIPFAKLVDELQPDRDTSRSPMFQVMFVLQNPTAQPKPLDLEISSVAADWSIAKFDLTLSLYDDGNTIRGAWEYNADLFDVPTLQRMSRHLHTLLAAIIEHPDQPISQLPLLSEQERRRLLVTWNDTAVEHHQDLRAHQWFERQVDRTPDALALVCDGEHWTYLQLEHRANQLSHYLHRQGIGPDVAVGLFVERSAEMVVGILAILKAGGAYLPLDPSYPMARLAAMLDDTHPPVVLTSQELSDRLPELALGRLCLETNWDHSFSKLRPKAAVSAENLAYIMYTSGSTGRPNGVAMQHAPLSNLIRWYSTNSPSFAGRTLQLASPSFDMSFVEILNTLSVGGTLVLSRGDIRRDTMLLARVLLEEAIETTVLPGTILNNLVESVSPAQLMALRQVITAGEQLHISTATRAWFEHLPQCRLQNDYGPSETHVVSSYSLPSNRRDWQVHPPIGKPISNTRIYVLDLHLRPVPVGVVGRIYLAGQCVSRGYQTQAGVTASRFLPDCFDPRGNKRMYDTGDLARYLPSGDLQFVGRSDHQVKMRGYRIELGEVEAMLNEHPSIERSVVALREDHPGDKRLVGYCVPVSGDSLDFTELRQFLRKQLPEHMVPSTFAVLKALPLTSSGKLDRRALPAPDDSHANIETVYVPPQNAVEEHLASIWSEILGVDQVGIHDNFFALGGHSLRATRVISRISQQLQIDIPLRVLFERPTIHQLAYAIEALLVEEIQALSDEDVQRLTKSINEELGN